MWYWPTLHDMLGGMTQDEQDEFLVILAGAAAAEVILAGAADAEQAAPAAHLHDAPVRQSPCPWYYG